MTTLCRTAVVLLIAAGCSSAAEAPKAPASPRRPAVAAPRADKPSPPPPDPEDPIVLPSVASAAAPWRQQEWDGGVTAAQLFTQRELVAVGTKAALVRTGGGTFVVDAQRGVVGLLALPAGARWVGMGRGDEVFAATDDGAVYRAPDLDAAMRPRGFVARATVARARAWDAGGGVIAAIADADVHVSKDGGATFTRKELAPKHRATDVFVRSDGIVVAVARVDGKRRTFISRDAGQTWVLSAHQPDSLERKGSWIWNGDWDCPAILGKDGRQWTSDGAQTSFDDQPWRLPLSVATTGNWGTAASPSPPPEPPVAKPGRGVVGGPRRCTSRPAAEFGMIGLLGTGEGVPLGVLSSAEGSGGIIGTIGKGSGSGSIGGGGLGSIRRPPAAASSVAPSSCAGAQCLAGSSGPRPLPTKTDAVILRDGTCEKATGGDCKPDGKLARPPTVAFVDRERSKVSLSKAPGGCAPRQLDWVGGLAVLLCGAEGERDMARVYVTDRSGKWRREGAVALPLGTRRTITMSSDGTLLLHPASPPAGASTPGGGQLPEGAQRAFVRPPRAVGAADAWREVTTPNAVAYRALDAGRVLVATSTIDGKEMMLYLDGTDVPKKRIAIVDVAVDVVDLAVKHGTVLVRAREAFGRGTFKTSEPTVQLYVSHGGKLLPHAGAPAFEATP